MIIITTKKVGTTGRFKNRYGVKTRAKVAAVETTSRAKHACPSCMKQSLKRTASGIWECRSCSLKIAGGAYAPETSAAKILKQVVRQQSSQ